MPGPPRDVAPVDLLEVAAATPGPPAHHGLDAGLTEREGVRPRPAAMPVRLLALPGLGAAVGAFTARAGRPRPAPPRERLALALHVREVE
ncbi:hypothetical protein [Nannocystis pusilla]|uniref:Uncharacterized protein n=1 Tax=Nannocystis pusilla TaxID=889268 RepID=A0ABS7TIC0_9BACT|nr:hypothetical protein [Nannocystis pusilla]MBZ5707866.1 hypothetical protein [Nannocystis pusilla]